MACIWNATLHFRNLGNSAQNHGAHSGHMIETFGDDNSRTSSFDHIRVDVVALSRTL